MDKSGLTLLYFATKSGCKEAAYALMNNGADLFLGNKNNILKYFIELINNANLKQLQGNRYKF